MHAFGGFFLDINDVNFTKDQQIQRCEDLKNIWLKLQTGFKKQSEVIVCPTFSKAMERLDDNKKYNVLVTGSIHLVGAAMIIIDPTLGGILVD